MLKLTIYTNESISRKIVYYYGRMIYISEVTNIQICFLNRIKI